MAYVSTSGLAFPDKATLQAQIFANLVSAGWTLHDNQDGSGYRVYRTSNEAGDRLVEYMKITHNVSGTLQFNPYLYWDTSTHTGSGGSYSTVYGYLNCNESSTNILWMMAAKDISVIAVNYSGTYSTTLLGHIPNRSWPEIATLSSEYTLSTTPTVCNVSGVQGTFVVGRSYQAVGYHDPTTWPGTAGVGRYPVIVTAVGSGTLTLTCASTITFPANSLVGARPSLFTSYPGSSALTWGLLTCTFASSGTATASDGMAQWSAMPIYGDSVNASIYKDGAAARLMATPILWMLNPYSLAAANDAGYYGYSDSHCVFIPNNNGASASDLFYYNQVASGTVTGTVTASTVQDSSQAWTVNAYSGQTLIVTAGQGTGQTRRIASNTSNTLTLTQDLVTLPLTGNSTYIIVESAYRAFFISGTNWLTCMQEATS
jgi:hypothetical protein